MIANKTKIDLGQPKPLRPWPGILFVILQLLIRYVLPVIIPDTEIMMIGVMGVVVFGLAILIWWLFFSRAAMIERWGGLILMVLALYVTSFFIDQSIATSYMGLMYPIFAIPVMCVAMVVWAIVARNMPAVPRRVLLIAAIVLASGIWLFLRTDGMDGDGHHELTWRWSKSYEDFLLEQAGPPFTGLSSETPVEALSAEWPGFRGAGRDGIAKGIEIETDWLAKPPIELWRKTVGPGCSSFAIRGNLFYTQEQRGDYEMASCYKLSTGEAVWQHSDEARFWDSHAGAGPRSTPTIKGEYIFTLGGTGILNALNAYDGSSIWSRDAARDAGVEVLTWGFTSSPLVVDSIVIVALAGKLAAYHMKHGEPLWFGPDGGSGYSSPQLFSIAGTPQVLFMSEAGGISVDPVNGKILWEYSWPHGDRILQPAMIGNGDLLFSKGYKELRRVGISKENDTYSFEDVWTSEEMKVNFNDHVIHEGYAYGFDGPSLVCVDLSNGKRMWKGHRYRGWIILLADQDVMLILSERGGLALVKASPGKFEELSKIKAIEGKTWNHPALAGNIILVRNNHEMAAFKIPSPGN